MRRAVRLVFAAALLGTIDAGVGACSLGALDGYSGGASPTDAGDAAAAPSDAAEAADTGAADAGVVDAEAGAPSGYAAAVLADAPVGYWRLDEAPSATSAQDSSGNGRHAMLLGSVTFGKAGVAASSGASFAGGKLSVGTGLAFASRQPFTLEAWVKPATLDESYRRVASGETTVSPRSGFLLWTHGTSVGFERLIDSSGVAVEAKNVLKTDAFVHIALRYDGTAAAIYVNGVFAEATKMENELPDDRPFAWGGSNYTNAPFLGELDELAVYDKALADDRILAHYLAGR